MKEHDEKLKDADKQPLEAAISKTREVAKGEDVQAIKSAISELEQASHALSKTLYEDVSPAGDDAAGAAETSSDDSSDASADEEDTIDAEFEVKKD